MSEKPIVIIGSGIAGLSCATYLHRAGRSVLLLDAGDRVGGRVRTDIVEGFRLDRGFQVLLDAYPEARGLLDYHSLSLKSFSSGALVFCDGRLKRIADPFRHPTKLLSTLRDGVGTVGDLWKSWRLARLVAAGDPDDLLSAPQTSTLDRLRRFGFTDAFIDRFFRAFYAGVFLEPGLVSSSRAFDFTYRMFARGRATVPALGMAEIPNQLASRLPGSAIRLNAPIRAIANRLVALEDGSSILAEAIVIATDVDTARRLAPEAFTSARNWTSTTCLYFDADTSPIGEPTIAVNGSGTGVVTNVAVMSDVSPDYAPPGRSLIQVSITGPARQNVDTLATSVRQELAQWFGPQTIGWRLLRCDRIDRALPAQEPSDSGLIRKRSRVRAGLFVAGDHVDQSNLNGAMCSGRRAAEAILADSDG
jgi:phytoene dehydrogenase-like protein